MNSNELKSYIKDFEERHYKHREEAKSKIREILATIPDRQIVSEEALGYFMFENMGNEWVEETIHAIWLDKDDTIRITPEPDYDEDDKPCINSRDDSERRMSFSEYDHYANINWPLTLISTGEYLTNHPELPATAADENGLITIPAMENAGWKKNEIEANYGRCSWDKDFVIGDRTFHCTLRRESNTAGRDWFVHVDNDCFDSVGSMDVARFSQIEKFLKMLCD